MTIFAQSQHCYHTYLILKILLSLRLFHWHMYNHTPLSKPKFVEHVCRTVLAANIPAHLYTGHSFRIGAATTAASAGIEDSTIQTLGHWKSSAYLLYIRLNPSHLENLYTTIMLSAPFNYYYSMSDYVLANYIIMYF